jgi:hypothetical protein
MKMTLKSALFTAAVLAAGIVTAAAVADDKPATQPSADQQMENLLGPPSAGARPLPTPPGHATDRSSGAGAVAPGAPALPLVREGTHLINRSGRLNHSTDGAQAYFTFDADGKTMKDAPMIILPNLKLLSMEGAVAQASKDVRFRISGTVTEYKGRNYILIDKAVVTADVDQGL